MSASDSQPGSVAGAAVWPRNPPPPRFGTMRQASAAGSRIARKGKEHAANRRANVLLEIGLRHARFLKVKLVEDSVVGARHHRGRPAGPRGRNGTLRPTTAGNLSGLNSAQCQATGAPQSWPTIAACFSSSASSTPTMSPVR